MNGIYDCPLFYYCLTFKKNISFVGTSRSNNGNNERQPLTEKRDDDDDAFKDELDMHAKKITSILSKTF